MRGIRKKGEKESGRGLCARTSRYYRFLLFFFSCFPAFLLVFSSVSAAPIIIGSKKFTESYVLAEIAKRAMENAGIATEHRQGMGGTIILWQAVRGDQIALYP